jgi:hypothetical protein
MFGDSTLAIQIRGIFNELQLQDLKKKTLRGQMGQKKRGFSVGERTFGYRSAPQREAVKTRCWFGGVSSRQNGGSNSSRFDSEAFIGESSSRGGFHVDFEISAFFLLVKAMAVLMCHGRNFEVWGTRPALCATSRASRSSVKPVSNALGPPSSRKAVPSRSFETG